MRLSGLFLLASFVMTIFSGCASAQYQKPRRVSDENVSTIGWNRPERWEGGGMLGAMMGQ
jgi:hypothetical protein